MTDFFKKTLWIFVLILPGVIFPDMGLGQLSDEKKKKGEDKRAAEYNTWNDQEKKLFDSAQEAFFIRGKIDINAPAKVLFRIKLDNKIDKYLGDKTQCDKYSKRNWIRMNQIKDAVTIGKPFTLLRKIILDCNQNQLLVPGVTEDQNLSDILKSKSYQENQTLVAEGATVPVFGKINPPTFYTQWPAQFPETRFKNVLIFNLLGDLYRTPVGGHQSRLTDEAKKRLETCIMGYASDTLENIKKKLETPEHTPEPTTHGCEEFFVRGDIVLHPQTIPASVTSQTHENVTSDDYSLNTPYERLNARTAIIMKAFGILDELDQSTEHNICYTKGRESLRNYEKSHQGQTLEHLTSHGADELIKLFLNLYIIFKGHVPNNAEQKNSSNTQKSWGKSLFDKVGLTSHKTQTKSQNSSNRQDQLSCSPFSLETIPPELEITEKKLKQILNRVPDKNCQQNEEYMVKFLLLLKEAGYTFSAHEFKAHYLQEWMQSVLSKIEERFKKNNSQGDQSLGWLRLIPSIFQSQANHKKTNTPPEQEIFKPTVIELIEKLHESCKNNGPAKGDADWFWVMANHFFAKVAQGLPASSTHLKKQQTEWENVSF